MTTRVLHAFDILDNRSKSTLDRFAKKNYQLTQMSTHCFAHGRSATGLGLHYEFCARKKPKANKDIINEEQDLLYKRLRKSLSVAASMQSSSRSKSVEAGSSRVVMHPETHAEKSSPRHFMSRGKEEGGLRSLPKRPQTLRLCTESPRRTTWSREVEKVPSLRELTKVNRSKALVGISLGNADICHWCSGSVHGEVNAPFKSAQPDESMKTQQLQENTDDTNTITSTLQNKTEYEVYVEPVPLTLDDLLKREDVTVLTPRLPEAFLSQKRASETSPVVYSTRQRHYEPFSGPGFHSLDGAPEIRQRNLRSAIMRYTEAMQPNYMREKQTGECLRSCRPYTQAGVKSKKTGVQCVGMCVLTADGKVIRSPDNTRLPLQYHDEAPSLCSFRCTDKALTSKQNASSPWVGPVINGMNANRTCNSGKTSPASCKPLPASPRRSLSCSARTSTLVSQ